KLIQTINDARRSFWYKNLGIFFQVDNKPQKPPSYLTKFKNNSTERTAIEIIERVIEADKLFSPLHVKTKRVRFESSFVSEHPTERVAGKKLLDLQHTILLLAALTTDEKEPFIHLWHLPGGSTNLFGFRIDTDFATDEELMALYKLCRKYDIRATWFVEVKSRKERLDIFRDMENQEIALHCFNHRLSRSRAQQSRDIMEALRYMKLADLHPKGYAAPYGEWRHWLPELLRDFGFEYSSEFGLAYDALPFFPPGNRFESLPPQIPIHPISVNRLKHARHTPSQMTAYYLDVLYRNSQNFLPTFLYHHPGQGYLNVWETIFRNVREKEIPVMSMGDYAAWWKRRTLLNWSAEWVDNKIRLSCEDPVEDVCVCAYWPGEQFELRSFNRNIESVKIKNPFGQHYRFESEVIKEIYKNVESRQGYSWRMFRHDLLWHYRRLKQ
ncbi:MAG: polysaccharide deacetylase family protein, partial [Calditrichota bacterium]